MLGSTEILLRSKANGLSLSDQVGKHFTGNGDVLGFGYDTDTVIDGVGYGPVDFSMGIAGGSAVPEPSTLVLISTGLGLIAATRFRRGRRVA